MKKILKILGSIVGYYVLIQILYVIMMPLFTGNSPSLDYFFSSLRWHFYNWQYKNWIGWTVSAFGNLKWDIRYLSIYSPDDLGYNYHIYSLLYCAIFLVLTILYILVIVFIYRKPVKSFITRKKSTSKASRIEELEKRIKDLEDRK